ncbi:MAG: oligosaccharide flippase family protein, partial [Solirubrobacterales bacterium]|nr:oligosaccharide flippase family protein [Solirubrobacterales bacterium]
MLRNIASNWALSLVTIVVTYVLTPFTIHRLGDTTYGTWVLITSTTGYLLLLTLGVPMASVRFMAQYAAEGNVRQLNAAIGTSARLYLALGAVALIIGCTLFLFFDAIYVLPASLRSQARLAFFLVVLYVSASFIGQLPFGIMAAHRDFVRRNAVLISTLVLRLGLTLVLLAIAPSLVTLAVVLLLALLFQYAAMWLVVKARYPTLTLQLSASNSQELRRIFSFSAFVLVLSVGERLMFQSDALVIGAFIGVSRVAYYAVANSVGLYLTEFVIAIAAVVMPAATTFHAHGQRAALEEVFLKWSKVTLSLTLLAGMFLLVLGRRLLGWWIGPDYEVSAGRVLEILTVGALFYLPVRGVALPILMGVGQPQRATLAYLLCGVLNVGLSIWLARPLGLIGVALGTTIPLVVYAAILLLLTCRAINVSFARYTGYVVPRALLGSLAPLAVLVWFKFGINVRGI